MSDKIKSAVTRVLTDYFDGLYYSDTSRLKRVFHPKAHYVCAREDTLQYLTMENYFAVVDARTSPEENGEERRDKIILIKLAGPSTAFAHVECSIGTKFFSDFLTLVRVAGKWQIISKVFHYDVHERA